MFCPKCGSQVADGASFCPACGNPLNAMPTRSAEPAPNTYQQYQQPAPQYQQPAPQYQQPALQYQQPVPQYQQPYQQYQQPFYGYNPQAVQQERIANLQELERMYGYFSQKGAEYDEYDAINTTLDEYDKRKPGLLVWGIILFVVGFITLVSLISADYSSAGAYIFMIVWLLGSVGMILAFIFGSIARGRHKEEALNRLVELADDLHYHYVNYGDCLVGEEFTNPAILQTIANNIQSGRANNITDSINIMFDDAHKSQMEYAAMETMYSSRQAAAGARTAAVFAAANFFLR
ncbi:MAG: zinc ribbon domain-containing protein [Lachnospiraceae bacterium]|nr:zinc ribbon domain-containing protein [Lachnospiraceae bacterium]